MKRDKPCNHIIELEQGLEDEQDQVRLDRMCILLYPIRSERLAEYLEMNRNGDLVTALVKRLSKNGIFDEELEWFRHELVKKCFEDGLGDKKRRDYHERAAKFFESLVKQNEAVQQQELNEQNIEKTSIEVKEAEENYTIAISYAYHLHMAGGKYSERSLAYNSDIAEYASKVGDLDIATFLTKHHTSYLLLYQTSLLQLMLVAYIPKKTSDMCRR